MSSSKTLGLAGLALATLMLTGCARTALQASAVDQFATDESEFEFWDELETLSVVTNDDALHGLLLIADGTDPHPDYAARLQDAHSRGWLLHQDPEPVATESATVGMIAVATCDILDLEGGVTMRIFGPGPRASTREIVFRELIPTRTSNQALSGLEFIDLAGRIEDARAGTSPEDLAGLAEMAGRVAEEPDEEAPDEATEEEPSE